MYWAEGKVFVVDVPDSTFEALGTTFGSLKFLREGSSINFAPFCKININRSTHCMDRPLRDENGFPTINTRVGNFVQITDSGFESFLEGRDLEWTVDKREPANQDVDGIEIGVKKD